MKRSRFSEEQIIAILKEQEAGAQRRTISRITSADELNPFDGLGGFARDLRGIRPTWQREIAAATQL